VLVIEIDDFPCPLLQTRLDDLEASRITSSKNNQTDDFQNEKKFMNGVTEYFYLENMLLTSAMAFSSHSIVGKNS